MIVPEVKIVKTTDKPIPLRAHHGMCLAFFEGRGYSEGFTAHMQAVLDGMAADPMLELVTEADMVCARCPNLESGMCNTAEKVLRYDRQVLSRCGLEVHAILPWSRFSDLVSQNILSPGLREAICGSCEWNEVCKARQDCPNF